MSLLIFLAVLFALVLVHELGHFAVAKWTGMRVDEFGIGFPPKLFGIRRGETEYTFNLFPIGGFVKIHGEDAVLTGKSDEDVRAFTSKNKWAQVAVLVAGVTMNILSAWILVALAFNIGVHTRVTEDEASEHALLTITDILQNSPAEKASLTPSTIIQSATAGGDTLASLTPSAFSAFVASHEGIPLTLVHSVGGELRVVQITPETGVIEGSEKVAIGVALAQVDIISKSPLDAFVASLTYVITGLRDTTLGITRLIVDICMLRADFSQVAGPVGIVGLVGEASAYGLTSILMFTAFISLNLAVINILPFPALDGGRLLFVAIEAVRRRPINPRILGTLNTIGFLLLILLMILVTWNDIMRLF